MAENAERRLILSVTLADCDVQTFRCGGNGGQKADKTSSGVRIVHRDSGAVGECREGRSQLQNKKTAFTRMTETERFKVWLRTRLGAVDASVAEVNRRVANKVGRDLAEENLRWEFFSSECDSQLGHAASERYL